jgi:hypothetical protein
MKIAIAAALIISSFSAFADGEMDGWYISSKGLHLVREVVYGNLYGQINYSRGNQIRFYIFNPNNPDCEKNIGKDIISHDPVYVDKKLVRMNQYCEGTAHYFYPATDAGNAYVIKEFSKSGSVEFKTYDESVRFVFSANNFKSIYAQLVGKSGGI